MRRWLDLERHVGIGGDGAAGRPDGPQPEARQRRPIEVAQDCWCELREPQGRKCRQGKHSLLEPGEKARLKPKRNHWIVMTPTHTNDSSSVLMMFLRATSPP